MASTAAMNEVAVGETAFGRENPFFAASELPYHAPPFDRIRDEHYLPALEAGIAAQRSEIEAIANETAAPTFANTLVALESCGQLLDRVQSAFDCVTGANTNPLLEKIEEIVTPKLTALGDAIFLNERLFERVKAVYARRDDAGLDAESRRLVDIYYQRFVHRGANLAAEDKERLKKLNEEESTLANSFRAKLLAATKAAAFVTSNKAALKGLSEAELEAAAEAAKIRNKDGYVLQLQNTTQQPVLPSLEDRATRQAVFAASWGRAERGGEHDTRAIVTRLAKLRAEKAALLGFASYAAWKLEDQMAKTPEAAVKFLDALVEGATKKAAEEAAEIQALIDRQTKDNSEIGFKLQPWDWDFYTEQVRKAKFDLDEEQLKPYFEVNAVMEKGVFYAVTLLFGITFRERTDLPVYHPEVRVFEAFEADGTPLALFYCDWLKRDNKNGGAWMSEFVHQSKLLGARPVIYNVANFPKPAAGEPALLSLSDVLTMFHEFGHTLHGMLSAVQYPTLAGTSVPRDFVEFPSQLNEHWALDPAVFRNYARHSKTGEAMPEELAAKIRAAETFNQGYALGEVLAAAELDQQWHALPASAPEQAPAEFEQAALERKQMALAAVPPRYRSSYFAHIWGGGYSASYYAYLWSEMLEHDGYQWLKENGGATRANGDRLRSMVLAKGNTEDPGAMYAAWRGREPTVEPMLKSRGLQ